MELWAVEALGMGALLGWASVFDLRHRIIPNALIGLGLLLKLLLIAASAGLEGFLPQLITAVLDAVVMAGLLLATAFFVEGLSKQESLGGGDVKLIALISAWFGLGPALLICACACMLVLLVCLLRRICRRPASQKGRGIPLAPYLFASFLLCSVLFVVSSSFTL